MVDEEELLLRIAKAFANTKRPSAEHWPWSQGEEDFFKTFRGHWSSMRPEGLDLATLRLDWSLLSDSELAYYLPAFLERAVAVQSKIQLPTDDFDLGGYEQLMESVIERELSLSGDQSSILRDVLEYVKEINDGTLEDRDRPDWDYWTPRTRAEQVEE